MKLTPMPFAEMLCLLAVLVAIHAAAFGAAVWMVKR